MWTDWTTQTGQLMSWLLCFQREFQNSAAIEVWLDGCERGKVIWFSTDLVAIYLSAHGAPRYRKLENWKIDYLRYGTHLPKIRVVHAKMKIACMCWLWFYCYARWKTDALRLSSLAAFDLIAALNVIINTRAIFHRLGSRIFNVQTCVPLVHRACVPLRRPSYTRDLRMNTSECKIPIRASWIQNATLNPNRRYNYASNLFHHSVFIR